MKKLRIYIIVFFLALVVPLSYMILQTYQRLDQEEEAELRYFAEELFDKMEDELALLVQREEARSVEEYGTGVKQNVRSEGRSGEAAPLSELPVEPFIIGYFQAGPGNSFQIPLSVSDKVSASEKEYVYRQLIAANSAFNAMRLQVADAAKDQEKSIASKAAAPQKKETSVAGRYFSDNLLKKQKSTLGRETKRVERLSVAQVRNIAPQQSLDAELEELNASPAKAPEMSSETSRTENSRQAAGESVEGAGGFFEALSGLGGYRSEPAGDAKAVLAAQDDAWTPFHAEIAPLQAVALGEARFYLFRRIVINDQIYRQGFVVKAKELVEYLADNYFSGQPLADFSNLRLSVRRQGREVLERNTGKVAEAQSFILARSFPRPFDFLSATLSWDKIPDSPGRKTLNVLVATLGVVLILGLFAIYQSARIVVEHSERRNGFVSSVTHELKTPLTNIRMYVEMLEQGIARDQEREQEYFKILGSESARLSRLINNVLEFSKLENKQRPLNMQQGDMSEVVEEVRAIMAEKLHQEGFTLSVENKAASPFSYDPEAMVQILINLIENSMKFGKESINRTIVVSIDQAKACTFISVSDFGPGIGQKALKYVFDDFFREDNSLTRHTKGTGIGLALVKKLVLAMGGSVTASNNEHGGCLISIKLPG